MPTDRDERHPPVRSVLLLLATLIASIAGTTTANAASFAYDAQLIARIDAHEMVAIERPALPSGAREASASSSVGERDTSTTPIAVVNATNIGGGSGPWVADALTTPVAGATRVQSLPGSCVAACGGVLTGARRTEAQLLDALGEWSNPAALADELGAGWQGGMFDSSAGALAAANRGPMGAVLQAPGDIGHMVVTTPLGGGRFQVLDPFDGTGYIVDSGWIQRYVSGGVWQ